MQNKQTTEEATDNYTKDELSKLGFINDDKWLKDRISNLNAVTNHLIFQKCYNEIIKSVLDTEMKFLYEKERIGTIEEIVSSPHKNVFIEILQKKYSKFNEFFNEKINNLK